MSALFKLEARVMAVTTTFSCNASAVCPLEEKPPSWNKTCPPSLNDVSTEPPSDRSKPTTATPWRRGTPKLTEPTRNAFSPANAAEVTAGLPVVPVSCFARMQPSPNVTSKVPSELYRANAKEAWVGGGYVVPATRIFSSATTATDE